MDAGFGPITVAFILKGVILTCVFSNAIQRWGIFQTPRSFLKRRSKYLEGLLSCYECSSVWGAFASVAYLVVMDITIVTYALIFHWVAANIRIVLDWMDAARAVKEGEIK